LDARDGATCSEPAVGTCNVPSGGPNVPLLRSSWIDAEHTDESVVPKVDWFTAAARRRFLSYCSQVRNGVKMGDGDGTVSLLSLGAMCVEGWKRNRWNPGGIKITTVEVLCIKGFVIVILFDKHVSIIVPPPSRAKHPTWRRKHK